MAKNPQTHTFKYSKISDFKTFGVTGAYGGMTVNGNLNINFYADITELPSQSKHEIIDGRIVKNPVNLEVPKDMNSIREVMVGINMDRNTAQTVIHWMQKHLDDFAERNKDLLTNETKDQE